VGRLGAYGAQRGKRKSAGMQGGLLGGSDGKPWKPEM
jgi:hypothetical protein